MTTASRIALASVLLPAAFAIGVIIFQLGGVAQTLDGIEAHLATLNGRVGDTEERVQGLGEDVARLEGQAGR